MKNSRHIADDVRRRLSRTWHEDVTGTAHWPHTFPLGQPSKADLENNFGNYQREILHLRRWAAEQQLTLTTRTRVVQGTRQDIPTAVTVPNLETAAHISGKQWPGRIQQARQRLATLQTEFPQATDWPTIVRHTDDYTDLDFTLLRTVATWFTSHDAHGLTPRQVPIPGVHAKWLNTHQRTIQLLTTQDTLGLAAPHPARIHFTYLDPTYLATGARQHDSATVGDTMTPAYTPTLVIISENKDTAINFPPTAGGIAIEGAGTGGSTIAKFPWITQAPTLLYWGDLDPAGFEILNEFRKSGVPATSMLMNRATLNTYGQFGTNHDPQGRPIPTRRSTHELDQLTPEEAATYQQLVQTPNGPKRLEQERIPLTIALAEAQRLASAP